MLDFFNVQGYVWDGISIFWNPSTKRCKTVFIIALFTYLMII